MTSAERKQMSCYICAFRPSVSPLGGSKTFKLISDCSRAADDVSSLSSTHDRGPELLLLMTLVQDTC